MRERTIAEVIVEQQEEINDLEGKLYRLANEMEYEGNSVAYIYSKAKNYGDRVHGYRLRAEKAERELEALREALLDIRVALEFDRTALALRKANDAIAAPAEEWKT